MLLIVDDAFHRPKYSTFSFLYLNHISKTSIKPKQLILLSRDDNFMLSVKYGFTSINPLGTTPTGQSLNQIQQNRRKKKIIWSPFRSFFRLLTFIRCYDTSNLTYFKPMFHFHTL